MLLSALLGDDGIVPEGATLASLGIDGDPALWDLWDAVREEFGERTLGPDDGAEVLDPAMTVAAAAATMAERIASRGDDQREAKGR